MKRAFILLFFMLGCLVIESKAQKIAVKSNLLYDATTTVNLGLEFGLARKWTLDIPVNYNPWKPDNGRRLRHWGVQPEARYRVCGKNMQKNRYQGHLYGGGISVGHSWILKKRWSIEASVGLGYARIEYEKYPCAECGSKLKDTGRNYFGPTKVALSIIYLIK